MRIAALLSWHDEDPKMLRDMAESLALLQPDYLVALEGAYEHYDSKPIYKPRPQRDALMAWTPAPCLIRPGHGLSEVEKRNRLFRLAQDADWFLIIDADETISHCDPGQLRDALANAPEDVAYVGYDDTDKRERRLYRNRPDLTVEAAHYGYRAAGRWLWDGYGAPAANVTQHLRLEHHRNARDPRRIAAQNRYYQTRDVIRLEPVPLP